MKGQKFNELAMDGRPAAVDISTEEKVLARFVGQTQKTKSNRGIEYTFIQGSSRTISWAMNLQCTEDCLVC